MNDIERQELEQEQAAREDYLHEAYGREARMLDEQAADEREEAAGCFTNVTICQMRKLLQVAKGWRETKPYREVVFEYVLKSYPTIVIKVFTGIDASGNSRACGNDAIRVAAVNGKIGWIKSSRINRVPGWEARLQAKVLEVIEASKVRARK